ncbi:AMP-dependent synthetase/ligase [Rhodocaloribacter sp.]
MKSRIYTAPPEDGEPVLGRTLPSLLYEACERYPNPRAFNQPQGDDWRAFSYEEFRIRAEEMALGLQSFGLQRGDRVAFFMESDVYFCLADMACLIAGVIDVPIYLTHTEEALRYVLDHSEAKALFVSNLERLVAIAPVLEETPHVKTVILAEPEEGGALPPLPESVGLVTMEAIRQVGRTRREREPEAVAEMLERIDPQDLATIIYTSGTTGLPKGVMLTHENISSNALTAFQCMTDYAPGPRGEVVLSFLPMTHVFARTLYYGYLGYGTSVYFTTPNELTTALPKVRPTLFATVPRVLEKVYARILERAGELPKTKRRLFRWSLAVAESYELGRRQPPMYRLKRRVADTLVFDKWRAALGGRVKHVICGGAALNARLANTFAAAGIDILEGYGLTETSPIITFNRPGRNRAGTVGQPIPGVEVMIADDGEILTRGPHVMKGYYRDEERTREVLDPDGWFHTGDIGEFTEDGYLRITDRKKDLFKLSTGKYVIPQPLENRLTADPLVEQAVVVGPGYKYATALIFPNEEGVRLFARTQGIDDTLSFEELLEHPKIVARFQELVDRANVGMDPWSTIKKFKLVPAHLTPENGMLTPTLKVKRSLVYATFADEIAALYED